MSAVDTQSSPKGSLLASILSEDSFRPAEPRTIEETGLTAALIENLVLKYVLLIGSASGRQTADQICLPFGLLEPIYQSLRQRQLLINCASAQLNDFVYTLTDQGRQYYAWRGKSAFQRFLQQEGHLRHRRTARVPLGPQGLDQPGERQVLVRERAKGHPAHPLEQLREARIAAQIGAEDELGQEEAEEPVQLRPGPVEMRRAHDHPLLPGLPGKQDLVERQDHHERRWGECHEAERRRGPGEHGPRSLRLLNPKLISGRQRRADNVDPHPALPLDRRKPLAEGSPTQRP